MTRSGLVLDLEMEYFRAKYFVWWFKETVDVRPSCAEETRLSSCRSELSACAGGDDGAKGWQTYGELVMASFVAESGWG